MNCGKGVFGISELDSGIVSSSIANICRELIGRIRPFIYMRMRVMFVNLFKSCTRTIILSTGTHLAASGGILVAASASAQAPAHRANYHVAAIPVPSCYGSAYNIERGAGKMDIQSSCTQATPTSQHRQGKHKRRRETTGGAPQPPPQAVNAGYMKMIFNTDFASLSLADAVDCADQPQTKPWHQGTDYAFQQQEPCSTQISTVYDSVFGHNVLDLTWTPAVESHNPDFVSILTFPNDSPPSRHFS